MTGGESIVNFGSLDAWKRGAALTIGALRRGRLSVALFTLTFVAVGVAAAAFLPRSYSARAELLIKKNYVMPALANPKRSVPTGAESPTQSAAVSVLSRQSLEAIVRKNDLVARWDRERSPVMRLKDRVMARLVGPIPEDEKLDVLVELLAKKIYVNVDDEVVTVKAMWGDRATARDLVNGAVDAYLQTRRKLEVQAIADTYKVLKREAEQERARIDSQLTTVQDAQRVALQTHYSRPVRVVRAAAVVMPKDDGLGDLRARILQARQTLLAAERRHEDKVAELQSRLAERRATQTERHPDVVALKLALDRLRGEPQDVADARAEEGRLMADYTARGGRAGEIAQPALAAAGQAAPAAAAVDAAPVEPKDVEDDATTYARSLFKGSLETYQDIMDRLRNVEIELATAEVAFGYRYTVTSPALLPKKPDSPNVVLIVVGALLAGAMAGAVRALFKELESRALLSPAALMAHLTAEAADYAS
jgi:polysaccharide biosynthesis transport protein